MDVSEDTIAILRKVNHEVRNAFAAIETAATLVQMGKSPEEAAERIMRRSQATLTWLDETIDRLHRHQEQGTPLASVDDLGNAR